MLHARISSLLSSLSRVKTRAGDAHARISGLTRRLARMQYTCDLMRKTARVLYLRRKINSQLPVVAGSVSDASSDAPPDLAAAASHLFELKRLLADEELRGIDVVEEDRNLAKRALKEVEARGGAILETGMSTPNQSQIASGLRVFANLGVVDSVAQRLVDDAVLRVDKIAADSLNLNNLVNASTPATTSAARVAGGPPGRAVMPEPSVRQVSTDQDFDKQDTWRPAMIASLHDGGFEACGIAGDLAWKVALPTYLLTAACLLP